MFMPLNIGKKTGIAVLNVTCAVACTCEPVTHGVGQVTLRIAPLDKLAEARIWSILASAGTGSNTPLGEDRVTTPVLAPSRVAAVTMLTVSYARLSSMIAKNINRRVGRITTSSTVEVPLWSLCRRAWFIARFFRFGTGAPGGAPAPRVFRALLR